MITKRQTCVNRFECYARLGRIWSQVDLLDGENIKIVGLGAQLEGRIAGNLEILINGDLVPSEVVAEAGLGNARRQGDQCRRQPHCELDVKYQVG